MLGDVEMQGSRKGTCPSHDQKIKCNEEIVESSRSENHAVIFKLRRKQPLPAPHPGKRVLLKKMRSVLESFIKPLRQIITVIIKNDPENIDTGASQFACGLNDDFTANAFGFNHHYNIIDEIRHFHNQ